MTTLTLTLLFNLWPLEYVIPVAAVVVALVATWLSWPEKLPDWLAPFFRGLRPLLIPGGAAVAVLIGVQLMQFHTKSLWPLFLAGAAFLYLWWIGALLFDLVFVWHRYIRNASLDRRLRKYRLGESVEEKSKEGSSSDKGNSSAGSNTGGYGQRDDLEDESSGGAVAS